MKNGKLATARIAAVFVVNAVVSSLAFGQATGTVSPFNGTGAQGTQQTIAFTASDPGGWSNIGQFDMIINSVASGGNACFFAYFPSLNSIYLFNNSTSGWAGSATLGVASSASNSQCTIFGIGSSATSGPGGALSLTVNVSFSFPIGTLLYYWEQVVENAGSSSGWWQLINSGSSPASFFVTRPNDRTPSVGTVSPLVSTTSPGTLAPLAFSGTDADGSTDIAEMDVVINSIPNGGTGCFWVFFPYLNAVYLVQTTSPFTWTPVGVNASAPQTSASSAYCTLSPNGTSASGSGTAESLNLNFSLSSALWGTNYVWQQITDLSKATSGWQQVAGASITVTQQSRDVSNLNDFANCVGSNYMNYGYGNVSVCSLQPGSYQVTNTIIVARNNITITTDSYGAATLRRATSTTPQLLQISSGISGVTIRNLIFDGNNSLYTSSWANNVNYSELYNDGVITVVDSQFINSGVNAIWSGPNAQLTVYGSATSPQSTCKFSNGLTTGILAGGLVQISYCYFTGYVGAGIGLATVGTGSNTGYTSYVSNNYLYYNKNTGGQIYLSGDNNLDVTGNYIDGGWSQQNSSGKANLWNYGIELDAFAPTAFLKYILCSNNIVTNHAMAGYWIGAQSGSLTGISLTGESITNNGALGLQIENVSSNLGPLVELVGVKTSGNNQDTCGLSCKVGNYGYPAVSGYGVGFEYVSGNNGRGAGPVCIDAASTISDGVSLYQSNGLVYSSTTCPAWY